MKRESDFEVCYSRADLCFLKLILQFTWYKFLSIIYELQSGLPTLVAIAWRGTFCIHYGTQNPTGTEELWQRFQPMQLIDIKPLYFVFKGMIQDLLMSMENCPLVSLSIGSGPMCMVWSVD